MRRVVKFFLALAIFSALTACCMPMHPGYGSHGNHGHDFDENHDYRKQRGWGHYH